MRKTILTCIICLLLCGRAGAGERSPRYISLAPSTTEILFALGLDEEVVAVSSFCNFPEAARAKEKIGDFSRPNIEKILSLKPDYIFCTGLEQAPVIEELRRLKLNVYVSDPVSVSQLSDSIKNIGMITNKNHEAQRIVQGIRKGVSEMQERVTRLNKPRPKVFIEIWYDPLTTAGPGSFVDELLSIAGGENIASDTKRPYSIYSPEQVIKHKPDCILLAYMGTQRPIELMLKRAGWQDIPAIRNKCLYDDINPDIILRPGPRIIEGLEEIHKRLFNQ
ncbi:MAG: cobalamin-binding protein [Candidatus Omnitrophica bacterium]|nr:cobalamin-binding protein [Candidatus Omnitrophota bacterium]